MKMNRIFLTVFILLLWTLPLDALTMEEAVELSIKNNHQIKEYKHFSEAQRQRVNSQRSAFMPEVNLTYSFTKRDKDILFQTRDASTFIAEATYNLFNGFIDIKELKAAESQLNASIYQQKALEADVVFEVKKAYIEVLRARHNLAVAQEAVSLLERQKHDIKLYYREGLVAKNEVLKVEVELASARQELLKTESILRIARKTLERILSISLAEDEVIEETGKIEFKEIEYKKLLEETLKNRSEIKYLKSLHTARKHTRDSIKGGYLPSIDLSLIYDRYGDSVVPDGRDELYDSETKAMIVVKWNIFDGFSRKHDIGVEESEIMAIEERINDTVEELKLQLKNALEGYSVSKGRLKVAKKAVEQAKENYRITENQFRQRMTTTTDLLDARFFLTRAHNDYSNATYDMYKSIAEIERVVEN